MSRAGKPAPGIHLDVVKEGKLVQVGVTLNIWSLLFVYINNQNKCRWAVVDIVDTNCGQSTRKMLSVVLSNH